MGSIITNPTIARLFPTIGEAREWIFSERCLPDDATQTRLRIAEGMEVSPVNIEYISSSYGGSGYRVAVKASKTTTMPWWFHSHLLYDCTNVSLGLDFHPDVHLLVRLPEPALSTNFNSGIVVGFLVRKGYIEQH